MYVHLTLSCFTAVSYFTVLGLCTLEMSQMLTSPKTYSCSSGQPSTIHPGKWVDYISTETSDYTHKRCGFFRKEHRLHCEVEKYFFLKCDLWGHIWKPNAFEFQYSEVTFSWQVQTLAWDLVSS